MSLLNPDFRDMLLTLSAESAEYLIVGAYSLAAHGIPRATGDLGIWVNVVALDGLSVPVLSLQDLLTNKRAAGRPKDLEDVRLIEARGRSR